MYDTYVKNIVRMLVTRECLEGPAILIKKGRIMKQGVGPLQRAAVFLCFLTQKLIFFKISFQDRPFTLGEKNWIKVMEVINNLSKNADRQSTGYFFHSSITFLFLKKKKKNGIWRETKKKRFRKIILPSWGTSCN